MFTIFGRHCAFIIAILFVLFGGVPRLRADDSFAGWSEVPGHGTASLPDAAITYNGKLYLFGIGFGDHAHYMNVFDGVQWTGWESVPGAGTTNLPDAATVYGGRLYLFGIGMGDHAHYVNTFDGIEWAGWKLIPGGGTTNLADAAITYNGKLYLFGIGFGDHAHYMNVFDGVQWTGWESVPGAGTTNLPDAATVYGGRLYLFGIGMGDHAHYVNTFDGIEWAGWKLIPGGGTTNLADAATTYNGKLYLFGIGFGDHAHYMNVFDGVQWSGWSAVPGNGTTSSADATTTFASKIYLFAGGARDHRHYVNIGTRVDVISPHFDEVFQKGSHNAYWVNNRKSPDDPGAAGPQMRLWDQLVHEHVRSIELDLHRDIDDPYTGRGTHPGEYRVYHTSEPENSTCFSLADCLQLLQRLDYVLPDHEVVHIALELKQVDRFFFDEGLFDDSDFRPEEVDRLLWEHLGPRIYTPAEFMSRCDPSLDLRHCAASAGWPTVDQLRGRYIVTIHGTETPYAPGACNERSWWQYASADIRTRAAFPMYVVSDGVTDDQRPANRANRYNAHSQAFSDTWRKALDNTIFFQLENPENPDFTNTVPGTNDPHVPLHRQFHGVVRSKAAHLVDHLPPAEKREDDVGSIMQETAVLRGWQIVMTDYPANFIEDVRSQTSPAIASRVDRPFFEQAEVDLATERRFLPNSLREPGSRIYFDTSNRISDHDIFDATAASYTTDPGKHDLAKLVRSTPSREREPVEDWEFFHATSMTGHSEGPLETTPFGGGCFDAGTDSTPTGDLVRVCRTPNIDDERSVDVRVFVWQVGASTYLKGKTLPHHLVQGAPLGDALRVRVDRSGNRTVVSVFTAAEVNPDGTMHWLPWEDGPFTFASDLNVQGFIQRGDGVFVGTRLNSKPVTFAEFALTPILPGGQVSGFAYDLSFCIDRTCREKPLASHERIFTDSSGVGYVGVNEIEGSVYGQWRTLYTTDEFEMTSSGLNQFHVSDKFLVRKDDPPPGTPVAAIYKCTDWRRDYHQHWLSTDMSCPNPNTKEPYAKSSGRMGYVAITPLPGALPLWHLRIGTHNAGSADTHDHYFAVGDAQRDVKINAGYSPVGSSPVGWVYTKAGLP